MLKLGVLVPFLAAYTVVLATKSLLGQGIHHAGSSRILDGKIAAPGAHPFMVSLRAYPNQHFCAGTIVNNLWILTAAHCMISRTIGGVFAVVGTNTLNHGGFAEEVRRVVIYPGYTGSPINNLAMVQLESTLSYSATIAQVALDITLSKSIINVTVIGWGYTSNDGPMSNYLREQSTETISQAACSQYWPRRITANHICTKFEDWKGACEGDSGGPLIHTNSKKQVGVMSFYSRKGCGVVSPPVFTRVSPYISWIQSTANLRG
ncbi:hypothetical protein Trydic_g12396 [Trypoxylus dichotomus]